MRCAADPTVEVAVLNLEVHIQSEQHFRSCLAEQPMRHLLVLLAQVGVHLRLLAHLNASRIERRILVLPRADEHNILEPVHSLQARKLEKAGFLDFARVGHAELRQRR